MLAHVHNDYIEDKINTHFFLLFNTVSLCFMYIGPSYTRTHGFKTK